MFINRTKAYLSVQETVQDSDHKALRRKERYNNHNNLTVEKTASLIKLLKENHRQKTDSQK